MVRSQRCAKDSMTPCTILLILLVYLFHLLLPYSRGNIFTNFISQIFLRYVNIFGERVLKSNKQTLARYSHVRIISVTIQCSPHIIRRPLCTLSKICPHRICIPVYDLSYHFLSSCSFPCTMQINIDIRTASFQAFVVLKGNIIL